MNEGKSTSWRERGTAAAQKEVHAVSRGLVEGREERSEEMLVRKLGRW